jgi:hypothetical protein
MRISLFVASILARTGRAYLCVSSEHFGRGGISEFNIGGTLTEFARDKCIDKNLLKDIILYYFRTRQLLATVRWVASET